MTLSISPSAARKMKYTTPEQERALDGLLSGEGRHVHVTGAQVDTALQQVHVPQAETPSARNLLGAMGNALTSVSYDEIMERIEALAEDAPGMPVSGAVVAAAMKGKREGL